ncbi:small heat shock protein [Cyathus striatus]|nr:small heat shock protein [Cyathus striatus]
MSSIFYYEPYYDFDRFLDELGSRPLSSETALQRRSQNDESGALRTLKPKMDLKEDSKNNLVTASFELPGLKKDDVQIDVHNNRMTVSGESQQSSDREEGGYAIRERRYGKFSRTLQLPQGVKDNQIKANMDNGILTVTFPKASPELAPKRIAVN